MGRRLGGQKLPPTTYPQPAAKHRIRQSQKPTVKLTFYGYLNPTSKLCKCHINILDRMSPKYHKFEMLYGLILEFSE